MQGLKQRKAEEREEERREKSTPSTKVVKSVFGEGKGAFRFTFSVSNEGEGDIPEQLRSFTWGVKDQKGRD